MEYQSPEKNSKKIQEGEENQQSSQQSEYDPTQKKQQQNIQNQTISTNFGSPEKSGQQQQSQQYSNNAAIEALINEKNNYQECYLKEQQENNIAQQKIQDLKNELDYYKQRAFQSPSKSAYQRELERPSSPLRPVVTGERSIREQTLDLEVQRLRQQLIEKNDQLELWMKKATRAEYLQRGDINLPEELALKQQEIDRLNKELTTLQLKSQNVGKLERDIADLNALLQFKEQENEELRNKVTSMQLENYKAKQNEISLRDSNAKLNMEYRHLRERSQAAQKEKDTIIQVKEHIHKEEIQKMKNTQELEKSLLRKDLQSVETLLDHKNQQLNEVSSQNNRLDRQLLEKSVEARQKELEASTWKERAGSAEKQVQYVTEKSVHDQIQLKEQLKREQSVERMVLQDKIRTLENIVSRKQHELNNTQLTLAETNQKKREVELAKLRLQGAVNDLEKKNAQTEQIYQSKIQTQDYQHQREVNLLKSSHDFEKQKLNQNINSLQYVADHAIQEREQQRQAANQYQREYLRSAEKKRQVEIEKNIIENNYRNLQVQKDVEVQQIDNLRRSQIENLNNSHVRTLSQKQRENENLQYALGTKERQLRDTQYENSLTKSQVYQKQQEAARLAQEAQLWREKAATEQKARELDHIVQNDIRREENLRNHLQNSAQKQVYQQEISTLNNIIQLKQVEADDWRNNYHRVVRSPTKY